VTSLVTTGTQTPGGPSFIQRWLARLALVAIAAALLVPPLDDCFRIGLRVLGRDKGDEGAESRRC
jgi:hypothetical protein